MYEGRDSDIEDEFVLQLYNEEHKNVGNFESVISNYTDDQFRRHFRLSRQTFKLIVDKYMQKCDVENRVFANGTPKTRVYMFLWYLASNETFRQIGNRFGFSSSHTYDIIVEMALFMANESIKLVQWPSLDEQENISAGFKSISNIDNIIGVIGCTHIQILMPKYHQQDFYNRNKYHKVQMQATVDHNKKFTSVYFGEPGSMHDAQVLRRCKLFKHLCERQQQMVLRKGFLLGNLSYPKIYSWLVPPFKISQGMSKQEQQFNKLHSTSRIVLEQAFDLLKSRFRRLQSFSNIKKKLIILLVLSACGIHNLCIDCDDLDVEKPDETSQNNNPSEESMQITRQNELLRELIEKNIIT